MTCHRGASGTVKLRRLHAAPRRSRLQKVTISSATAGPESYRTELKAGRSRSPSPHTTRRRRIPEHVWRTEQYGAVSQGRAAALRTDEGLQLPVGLTLRGP